MLSNKVQRIPIASIQIDRENRQRREIDVSDIIESVKRRGILTPICVTKSGRLIFGERRITAAKQCGHTDILARIAPDDLSPLDLKLLELEENIMRAELPWQDKARSMLEMYTISGHTSEQTFASSIGYSYAFVHRMIDAAKEIDKGNERVAKAPALNKAINVITRQRERVENNAITEILDTIGGISGDAGVAPATEPAQPILCESFHAWAPTYTGPKFNLLHCDFPYGIGLDDSGQLQSGGTAHETYTDTSDTYWALLETLATYRHNFLSSSSHMIFWYSMKYHRETLDFLTKRLPEFTFDDYPLVWLKSDNKGIAPDVERRPRRIYETALFGWSGSRKLVKLQSNAYAAPKENSAHPSTKPEPVLRYFLSMVVDQHSRVFDPTCGSGSALRAADSLGAGSVLGLELEEGFHADAVARWNRYRSISKIAEMVS